MIFVTGGKCTQESMKQMYTYTQSCFTPISHVCGHPSESTQNVPECSILETESVIFVLQWVQSNFYIESNRSRT